MSGPVPPAAGPRKGAAAAAITGAAATAGWAVELLLGGWLTGGGATGAGRAMALLVLGALVAVTVVAARLVAVTWLAGARVALAVAGAWWLAIGVVTALLVVLPGGTGRVPSRLLVAIPVWVAVAFAVSWWGMRGAAPAVAGRAGAGPWNDAALVVVAGAAVYAPAPALELLVARGSGARATSVAVALLILVLLAVVLARAARAGWRAAAVLAGCGAVGAAVVVIAEAVVRSVAVGGGAPSGRWWAGVAVLLVAGLAAVAVGLRARA